MKVGIIGTGWVGSSVAISTLHSGVVSELLLADFRPELAEGEALDLAHGAAYYPSARVAAASVEEMKVCDAVVIAAGKAGSPEQSRLDLLRDNAQIVTDITRNFRDFQGVLVMVTNPVDVLTQVATLASGLPASRVLGTGTMLDTARLRQMLGRELSIDPRSVHAQVVGEHGDSEVILWSSSNIGGTAIRTWDGWNHEKEEKIARDVRRAAYEIIKRKGATNHAIGLVTASLLSAILRSERRILTVSHVQSGACGIEGVALSLPSVVSASGVVEVIEPQLDERERKALLSSSDTLHKAFSSLSIDFESNLH